MAKFYRKRKWVFGSAQKEWGHLTNPQLCLALLLSHRVGNFRQKNNSAEDGIDRTYGYFRRNSGCSAEQKTLGIPFWTIPGKRKQLGIPFRRTKIVTNTRNPFFRIRVNNQFRVPWNKNRSKLSECRSEPFCEREKDSEQKKQPFYNIFP